MTTVAAGASGSYTFTTPSHVSVALDAGERALVVVLSSAGAQVYSDRLAFSRMIGPFPTGSVLTITADGAAVDYTVIPAKGRGHIDNADGPFGLGLDEISLAALANSGVSLPRGAKNWKASNTVQLRASMAGAQGRDFRSRWVFVGDSSISGTGSARNGLIGARRKGWVSQLEDIGLAAGYQVNENWWMGDSGNTTLATITTGDPRVVFGSDCDYTANYAGPGRGVPRMNVGPTNGKITFTPRQTFDTIDVLFLTGAAGVGSATVQNQSGSGSGLFNTQIGNGNAEYSATVPAGSTAAVVAMTAATQVYVNGFGTRDSTKPGIEIINTGISGIDLQFFNANPAVGNNWNGWRVAASRLMTAATKNVVVLTAGANDLLIYSRTIEAIKTQLRLQIEALKALAVVPDIVFVSYGNLATPNPTTFGPLQQALIDVCINEYDLPVIDQRETMESGAVMQSLDMQAGDGLHGYASQQAITARNFFNACVASRAFVN